MTFYMHSAPDLWLEKMAQAERQFHAREISDDVFRAVLYAHGFRGARLADEFRYQDSLRITASYSQ